MRVHNVHERELPVAAARVGALIDSLASPADALWPARTWPRMVLDRPLAVGAAGGHGPIRYFVEALVPGESIRFRFTGPRGFDGFHQFDVIAADSARTTLRHTLEMNTHGAARVTWPLVFRPLHDALSEDALSLGEDSLGLSPRPNHWSAWVRVLRRLLAPQGRATAVL